jgi:hypothetical protein
MFGTAYEAYSYHTQAMCAIIVNDLHDFISGPNSGWNLYKSTIALRQNKKCGLKTNLNITKYDKLNGL